MENRILTPGINRTVIPVLFKDREYSNKSVLPEVKKPNKFITFIKNLFKL